MLPLVRLEKISELVRERGNLSIEDLSQALSVSPSSARRDLAKLEAMGELRRTHGGAVAIKEGVLPPLSFEEKKEINLAAKRRIAAKAAAIVLKGEIVCLDGGTTTQFIAENLTRFSSLTVITNSIGILAYLCRFPHIKLISVGGNVKHNIQGIVGNLSNEILERVHIDKLFLGADGIVPEKGIYTSTEMEAFTKAKMIASSKQVILVADSRKIGLASLVKFSSWDNIHVLITDKGCKQKYIDTLRIHKRKVRIITA